MAGIHFYGLDLAWPFGHVSETHDFDLNARRVSLSPEFDPT